MDDIQFNNICENICDLSTNYIYLNHYFTKEQKEKLINIYFSDNYLISKQKQQDFIHYISYHSWYKEISNYNLIVKYIFQEDMEFSPFNLRFISQHSILKNINFNNDILFKELLEYFLDKDFIFLAQNNQAIKLNNKAKKDFITIIHNIDTDIKSTFIKSNIESFAKLLLVFIKNDTQYKYTTQILTEFKQSHNLKLLVDNLLFNKSNFKLLCDNLNIICKSELNTLKNTLHKI